MIDILKNHRDIFFSILPILILIFIILDIGIFDLFDMEIGYFLTIIGNLNFSTYNYIFVLILIPLLSILMFLLALKSSSFITDILFEKYKTYKIYKKHRNIVYIFYIFFFFLFTYIITLYLITYISINLFTSDSDLLVLTYFLMLIISVSLNIIYSLIHRIMDAIHNGFIVFIVAQIIIFFMVLFSSSITLYNSETASKIFLFSCLLHLISFIMYIDKKNNTIDKIKKNEPHYFSINGSILYDQKIKQNKNNYFNIYNLKKKKKVERFYTIISGTIILFMIYTHIEINYNSWKNPIDNDKNTLSDLTLNLLFNRGMLINGTQPVSVLIPKYYKDKVESLSFYDKENRRIHIGLNSKYLEIGSNLKIYFKNNNNVIKSVTKVYVFLVEEKKFGNQIGSEHTLLSISSYNID